MLIGTNVINRAREMCPADTASEIPSHWQNVFCSLQNGFVGVVKSANKKDVKVEPFTAVTFSGLVRRQRDVETAITENAEAASSRLGVCPRVIAIDKAGQNQRVSVRVFNISAKTFTVTPHTPLCQLKEVKVLRHVDPGVDVTEDTAQMLTQTVDENPPVLPDGINLDTTDLSEEEKIKATHVFSRWSSVFSKDLKDIGHTQ